MSKTKKFEVKIYYSSFCTHIVEARDELEAIVEARRLKACKSEIMANLEPWDDADTIEQLKSNEKNRK